MTPEGRKRWGDRMRERHMISQYAPLEDLEKIARENIPALSVRVHSTRREKRREEATARSEEAARDLEAGGAV